MSVEIKAAAIADIDDVLETKLDYGGTQALVHVSSMMVTCIERWAPPGSRFHKMIQHMMLDNVKAEQMLRGILSTLRRDYEKDMVKTFEQIVHAAMFDDLLQQAQHLLDGGYLLASAVLAGATLEEHLRKLATNSGIALAKTNGKPKTASEINDELHKATAYPQPQWRQNQVWIDLRNEAAHNNPGFAARTDKDIATLITGVRDIIMRYPA